MKIKIRRISITKKYNVKKLHQKLSNVPINPGLNLKTRFFLREDEAYENKGNVSYFGAIFFEMKTSIFVQLTTFQVSLPIFVS